MKFVLAYIFSRYSDLCAKFCFKFSKISQFDFLAPSRLWNFFHNRLRRHKEKYYYWKMKYVIPFPYQPIFVSVKIYTNRNANFELERITLPDCVLQRANTNGGRKKDKKKIRKLWTEFPKVSGLTLGKIGRKNTTTHFCQMHWQEKRFIFVCIQAKGFFFCRFPNNCTHFLAYKK